MSVSVTMPRLGESVSEGTVTRWLKQEGDKVEADEPLLEVSTDKVDTEIPSPAAGVLSSIKVGEDETVEVGSELAVIDDGSGGGGKAAESGEKAEAAEQESPADPEPDQESTDEAPEQEASTPEAQQEPERAPETDGQGQGESAASADQREDVAADADESGDDESGADQPARDESTDEPAGDQNDDQADEDGAGGGPSYVTPLVRRLAAEHGVDLASIRGTGVGGRIRKQDVVDAAAKTGKDGKDGGGAPAQRKPEQAPQQPAAASG